jgi:hypothetical protein
LLYCCRAVLKSLASNSITFCLATSVFTHLLPKTIEQYLTEIGRVLQPEGRFLSTWFLLDQTTEAAIAEGKAQFNFEFKFANHAQVNLEAPEAAVAYRLDYLKAVLNRVGLEITVLQHGGWSGARQIGSIQGKPSLYAVRRLAVTF